MSQLSRSILRITTISHDEDSGFFSKRSSPGSIVSTRTATTETTYDTLRSSHSHLLRGEVSSDQYGCSSKRSGPRFQPLGAVGAVWGNVMGQLKEEGMTILNQLRVVSDSQPSHNNEPNLVEQNPATPNNSSNAPALSTRTPKPTSAQQQRQSSSSSAARLSRTLPMNPSTPMRSSARAENLSVSAHSALTRQKPKKPTSKSAPDEFSPPLSLFTGHHGTTEAAGPVRQAKKNTSLSVSEHDRSRVVSSRETPRKNTVERLPSASGARKTSKTLEATGGPKRYVTKTTSGSALDVSLPVATSTLVEAPENNSDSSTKKNLSSRKRTTIVPTFETMHESAQPEVEAGKHTQATPRSTKSLFPRPTVNVKRSSSASAYENPRLAAKELNRSLKSNSSISVAENKKDALGLGATLSRKGVKKIENKTGMPVVVVPTKGEETELTKTLEKATKEAKRGVRRYASSSVSVKSMSAIKTRTEERLSKDDNHLSMEFSLTEHIRAPSRLNTTKESKATRGQDDSGASKRKVKTAPKPVLPPRVPPSSAKDPNRTTTTAKMLPQKKLRRPVAGTSANTETTGVDASVHSSADDPSSSSSSSSLLVPPKTPSKKATVTPLSKKAGSAMTPKKRLPKKLVGCSTSVQTPKGKTTKLPLNNTTKPTGIHANNHTPESDVRANLLRTVSTKLDFSDGTERFSDDMDDFVQEAHVETTKLYEYARNYEWEKVREECKQFPRDAKCVGSSDGTTALHLAVISRISPSLRRNSSSEPTRAVKPASLEVIEELVSACPEAAIIRCAAKRYTPLTYACFVKDRSYDMEDAADVVQILIRNAPECAYVFTDTGISALDVHILSYSKVNQQKEEVRSAGRSSTIVIRTLLASKPLLADARSYQNKVRGPIELLYRCNLEEFQGASGEDAVDLEEVEVTVSGTKKARRDSMSGVTSVASTLSDWWAWKWAMLLLKFASPRRAETNGLACGYFATLHAATRLVACPLAIISLAMDTFPNQLKERDIFGGLGNLALHNVCSWVSEGETIGSDPFVVRRKARAIRALLAEYPGAAMVKNKEGKLPLQIAIQTKTPWHGGLELIAQAYPEALLIPVRIGEGDKDKYQPNSVPYIDSDDDSEQESTEECHEMDGMYSFVVAAALAKVPDHCLKPPVYSDISPKEYAESLEKMDLESLRTIFGLLRTEPSAIQLYMKKIRNNEDSSSKKGLSGEDCEEVSYIEVEVTESEYTEEEYVEDEEK